MDRQEAAGPVYGSIVGVLVSAFVGRAFALPIFVGGDVEALRCLGLVLMVVDHVGALLFPGVWWLRLPGRACYPIFAWLSVIGLGRSRDVIGYIWRLLLLGFVSQFGYVGLFGSGVNDVFALGVGAWAVSGLAYGRLVAVALVLWDPGHAVTVVSPMLWLMPGAAVWFWALNFLIGGWVQAWAVAAVPIVEVFSCFRVRWRLSRWFAYGFYPVHFWALLALRCWLHCLTVPMGASWGGIECMVHWMPGTWSCGMHGGLIEAVGMLWKYRCGVGWWNAGCLGIG